MRVVRNIGYIKRRKRAAKLMVGLGVVALAGSWGLTILYPGLFLTALVGLVLGFITFHGGMQQISRWSRRPRSDVMLDEELQRLNDRYTLIHYPDVPGRRPDHVLVAPTGLLVMTTREAYGRMRVEGTRWRMRRNPLTSMFMLGGPQLGNPSIENQEQVKALRQFLEREKVSVEPQGAIVFVADNVEVEIEDSPIPVLHVTEVYDYVRETTFGVTLDSRERDAVTEMLSRGEELEQTAVAPARPKKRVRAA